MESILGLGELFDARNFTTLVARLSIDLLFATIVIRLIYYRLYRNREYAFTYFLFNIITFTLSYLMRRVPIELGFALGLFAIFGILRYRTEPIRIRDLTYLFIVIGLGILNAVANRSVSVTELLFVNAAIVALAGFLELKPSNRSQRSQPILYDNLALLRPENREKLIADLCERTGLNVVRVDVRKIDMLRDAADLTIFYLDPHA